MSSTLGQRNPVLILCHYCAVVPLSQSKVILFVFWWMLPTNTFSVVPYSFLPNPSYRTDRNGQTLELASSEACCGTCMFGVTSPIAHVDFRSLCSNIKCPCRSHAHLEALPGVLVETFISHAKKARMNILPWIQSCPVSLVHICSTWSPSNVRSCFYTLHCPFTYISLVAL